MYRLRPIQESDEEAFIELAFSAQIGITSLPKNKILLKNKLQKSIESFNKNVSLPHDELYLFVLEEMEKGILVGTSGIFSAGERLTPSYYYQISFEQPLRTNIDNIPLYPRQYLKLTPHLESCTELCSLFLNPNHRKAGLGKLLSLTRLLFIACFPERFNTNITANLRGVIDDDGKSPFWEAIGKRFFNVGFDKIQELIQEDILVPRTILPENSIYTELIPKKAQKVIGIAHEDSLPALKMLENQSFKFINEIDPFDGGPKLETQIEKIPIIAKSDKSKIVNIVNEPENAKTYFICKNNIPFRGCYGNIKINSEHQVEIDNESAKALEVKIGDEIRFYEVFI